MKKIIISLFGMFLLISAKAEDGYKLWLRYTPLKTEIAVGCKDILSSYYIAEHSPVCDAAVEELTRAIKSMTGHIPYKLEIKQCPSKKTIIIGTPQTRIVADMGLGNDLKKTGKEGYLIKNKNGNIIIAANTHQGLLYGIFGFLKELQTGKNPLSLNLIETPKYNIRILNHWDNLDGTIERGYSGTSIWQWDELPDKVSARYKDYARANASIGINAVVLNNVNANPKLLTREYLIKISAIANVLRTYGIKVYLSANFASPQTIGGLPTADPLNKRVSGWWKHKVNEIYSIIPDFGGFLVKANSEGMSGPQDYGRTHVDGANMLADALFPHGGIVMWRAFVYGADNGDDRAKQAYDEFIPLDGKFKENVILQVKNGPIDFQPREPILPLFGAIRKTPVMPEFQITQEYLGASTHLAYLAPMYKECLDTDTYTEGKGSTVVKTTDGSLFHHKLTAIAGVSNIGSDTNWTGHHFAQANWYCFGRLAWDPALTPEKIAEEWILRTFTHDPDFVELVKQIMLSSREAVVNYMMPLGLNHLMVARTHYGPAPWVAPTKTKAWTATYYHKADKDGIGFDRTISGSGAVLQYAQPLRDIYNDPTLCPENLLLWFHHLPWTYRLRNGMTLWEALCRHYQEGIDSVRYFQKLWDSVEGCIDDERFAQIQSKLRLQAMDAIWWRDACVLYFQTLSDMPIPSDLERPIYDLERAKQRLEQQEQQKHIDEKYFKGIKMKEMP